MSRWVLPRSRILPLALVQLLMVVGCNQTGGTPEIKQTGIFTQSGGNLVEMRRLGTLATTYGPRLYPELPEYDIPVVSYVGPMYVNIPDVPVASLKGIDPKYGSLIDSTTGLQIYVPLQQQYTARLLIIARSSHGQRVAHDIRTARRVHEPEAPGARDTAT
jgi:hypothetical protein